MRQAHVKLKTLQYHNYTVRTIMQLLFFAIFVCDKAIF